MPTARFSVQVVIEAEVEIDEAVLTGAQTRSWKESYNDLSRKEVAELIGFNMLAHNAELTAIDGFADRKDSHTTLPGFTRASVCEALEWK